MGTRGLPRVLTPPVHCLRIADLSDLQSTLKKSPPEIHVNRPIRQIAVSPDLLQRAGTIQPGLMKPWELNESVSRMVVRGQQTVLPCDIPLHPGPFPSEQLHGTQHSSPVWGAVQHGHEQLHSVRAITIISLHVRYQRGSRCLQTGIKRSTLARSALQYSQPGIVALHGSRHVCHGQLSNRFHAGTVRCKLSQGKNLARVRHILHIHSSASTGHVHKNV
mmetsp:Transcript_24257/g.61729  ORF Transcript_24257/g.61729 Transcript_24257/m.61729 type:complete len:219 (+) Transcript_24257:302-958(+)